MKKKILYIADIYPFPSDTGGKLRTGNLLKQFTKQYHIDFVCFSGDPVSEEQKQQALRYCASLYLFAGLQPSKINKLLNGFSPRCCAEFNTSSLAMQQIVTKLIAENQYSFIWIERLYGFQYITKYLKLNSFHAPVYLDMHDIEHEAAAHFVKIADSLLLKFWRAMDFCKVRRLERIAVRAADFMVAVSKRDMLEYINAYPKTEKKWIYVNNGVDMHSSVLSENIERDSNTVLFIGSLRHPPNVHGIKWFIKNAWPDIINAKPDMMLIIAGSGEVSKKDQLIFDQAKNVTFLGYVDDVHLLMKECGCMIVPLFSGSGTRLKILEAFSLRLPVVSTSIGAEGIPVRSGEQLIIADSIDEMASGVEKMATSAIFAKHCAERAYQLVVDDYNWDNIGENLMDTINKQQNS